MELPNDVWNIVIDHIGYMASINDTYSRVCFLFLPLVNKQLHRLCKVHPSVQTRQKGYFDYKRIIEQFAMDGSLSCIKFAHENGFSVEYWRGQDRILLAITKNDNYEILEYLLLKGCLHCADNAVKSAIFNSESHPGKKCLEVIHKVGQIPFEAWDIERTIEIDHMEKFEYLWALGIRPGWKSIPAYIIANPKLKSIVDHLIKNKNLTVDVKSFEYYYEKGDMYMYEYTYTNGHSWPDNITVLPMRNNQLEALKYVHEHGAQWHIDACLAASENGAYDCLSYAHEYGAEWNQQACLERATEYLRKAVDATNEMDYGFSMGYIAPYYDEAGLVKCIKYLLAHQHCTHGSNSHVTPSEAEQLKMCKDYLDQRGAQMGVDFSVMYKYMR